MQRCPRACTVILPPEQNARNAILIASGLGEPMNGKERIGLARPSPEKDHNFMDAPNISPSCSAPGRAAQFSWTGNEQSARFNAWSCRGKPRLVLLFQGNMAAQVSMIEETITTITGRWSVTMSLQPATARRHKSSHMRRCNMHLSSDIELFLMYVMVVT